MATTLSLKERIEQRKKEMQDRKSGMFLKWVNDHDAHLVRIILPYEGYKRVVTNKANNTSKEKAHFRAFSLGGVNLGNGQPLVSPQPNYTIDQIRSLRIEDAKIFTAPESMELGILDGIFKKHSIMLIIRKGVANSTSTTYDVFTVSRMEAEELGLIAPGMTKEDIAKLDSEVDYEEIISEVEYEALVNGGKNDSMGNN